MSLDIPRGRGADADEDLHKGIRSAASFRKAASQRKATDWLAAPRLSFDEKSKEARIALALNGAHLPNQIAVRMALGLSKVGVISVLHHTDDLPGACKNSALRHRLTGAVAE